MSPALAVPASDTAGMTADSLMWPRTGSPLMMSLPGCRCGSSARIRASGLAGFLLAAVYSSTLLTSGYATGKQHIPLGPFMLAGASAVILAWPFRFLVRAAYSQPRCHIYPDCQVIYVGNMAPGLASCA
jgi:hypothetical protein